MTCQGFAMCTKMAPFRSSTSPLPASANSSTTTPTIAQRRTPQGESGAKMFTLRLVSVEASACSIFSSFSSYAQTCLSVLSSQSSESPTLSGWRTRKPWEAMWRSSSALSLPQWRPTSLLCPGRRTQCQSTQKVSHSVCVRFSYFDELLHSSSGSQAEVHSRLGEVVFVLCSGMWQQRYVALDHVCTS